jgi:hypothetical protein
MLTKYRIQIHNDERVTSNIELHSEDELHYDLKNGLRRILNSKDDDGPHNLDRKHMITEFGNPGTTINPLTRGHIFQDIIGKESGLLVESVGKIGSFDKLSIREMETYRAMHVDTTPHNLIAFIGILLVGILILVMGFAVGSVVFMRMAEKKKQGHARDLELGFEMGTS